MSLVNALDQAENSENNGWPSVEYMPPVGSADYMHHLDSSRIHNPTPRRQSMDVIPSIPVQPGIDSQQTRTLNNDVTGLSPLHGHATQSTCASVLSSPQSFLFPSTSLDSNPKSPLTAFPNSALNQKALTSLPSETLSYSGNLSCSSEKPDMAQQDFVQKSISNVKQSTNRMGLADDNVDAYNEFIEENDGEDDRVETTSATQSSVYTEPVKECTSIMYINHLLSPTLSSAVASSAGSVQTLTASGANTSNASAHSFTTMSSSIQNLIRNTVKQSHQSGNGPVNKTTIPLKVVIFQNPGQDNVATTADDKSPPTTTSVQCLLSKDGKSIALSPQISCTVLSQSLQTEAGRKQAPISGGGGNRNPNVANSNSARGRCRRGNVTGLNMISGSSGADNQRSSSSGPMDGNKSFHQITSPGTTLSGTAATSTASQSSSSRPSTFKDKEAEDLLVYCENCAQPSKNTVRCDSCRKKIVTKPKFEISPIPPSRFYSAKDKEQDPLYNVTFNNKKALGTYSIPKVKRKPPLLTTRSKIARTDPGCSCRESPHWTRPGRLVTV